MNKTQLSGKTDQLSGSVKQTVGEAIGNDRLANEGAGEQIKGAVKDIAGNAQAAIKDSASKSKSESEEHAKELRHGVTDTTQSVKKHINRKIDELRDSGNERRSA